MIGVQQIRESLPHRYPMEILPHRYPMLLLDRVDEIVAGERLRARKAVTLNEPWYSDLPTSADHAYPWVLLVESWGQAAGILAAGDESNPDLRAGMVMLFGSISDARVHGPVLPGDVIEHEVRLMRMFNDTMILEGESRVDGRPVLEVGRAVMALRPAEMLTDPQPARGELVDAQTTRRRS
jgi:3-hydroxyacyl-[acyl-carrier-protein] dehydratase